ncbi:hypothetical protein B9L19_09030 [Geobacillus thermocatenulatus]|uniref:Uncharacterized protein n=1 Tax=Geobacillus thermocatenulatus TaxID=33938 RepID=A0A226Q205_9BACL|nr:hypothetical protein GT3921_10135 [Geobacillus thermocatenulatus]OXB85760.1 hypothetical protein B9L19_09030 [Geobacillus thermocatenulatus]
MAQYHITLNAELLHGLFTRDEGLAKLLEQVLNQILDYFGIISTNGRSKRRRRKSTCFVKSRLPYVKRMSGA